ncbi:unnamed protein product [Lactuca saligna]|uniref:Uncharacterized protein n=1 Tax=Lactuca saligna TaxID=75948 RepID=A0AA35YTC5_LACSI|nr:unnamed protein product [Lactuca saligna]
MNIYLLRCFTGPLHHQSLSPLDIVACSLAYFNPYGNTITACAATASLFHTQFDKETTTTKLYVIVEPDNDPLQKLGDSSVEVSEIKGIIRKWVFHKNLCFDFILNLFRFSCCQSLYRSHQFTHRFKGFYICHMEINCQCTVTSYPCIFFGSGVGIFLASQISDVGFNWIRNMLWRWRLKLWQRLLISDFPLTQIWRTLKPNKPTRKTSTIILGL